MQARRLGQSLRDRTLHERIRPLRNVQQFRNLFHLAVDYATGITIAVVCVVAQSWCPNSVLGWLVTGLIGLIAIALMGGVQHRLAGLGHEAAHFTFLPHRFWNDLLADPFCMFPLAATLTQYRLVHTAHHQFTNDWERDPDLTEIGISKGMRDFPMPKERFIWTYFIRFFWPPTLLTYLWDVFTLSALGQGKSPYLEREGASRRGSTWLRLAGLALIIVVPISLAIINQKELANGTRWCLLIGIPVGTWMAATVLLSLLPDSAFFRSPIKQPYSPRMLASLRLAFFLTLFGAFAWARAATGTNWGGYFVLLWIIPLLTSFPYYMLLRDVYQHANADDGLLTNTRVFFADPFTRWAVFVYGQDLHLPHHLFPAIPHYNLLPLHRLLQEGNEEYARHATECHGTFRNDRGLPTILDVMETGTHEPETVPAVDSVRKSA